MVSQERETWKGRIDFLLACIGFCVGLGNIWRFPYLCFFHGGAAFLLPYIIMTLIVGLPLFFMELALGQFTSQGPVTSWKMNPLLSGIGWGMVVISAMTCIYYNVIVMYSLIYVCQSLVNIGWSVPWATCGDDWSTEKCRDKPLPKLDTIEDVFERISASLAIKEDACVQGLLGRFNLDEKVQIASKFSDNYTAFEDAFSACNIKYSLPSQEYWSHFILEVSDNESISSVGGLVGRNTLFLFFTWTMVFLCLLRGPQSIAKVVYFSATYPLGILIVLLIRSITTTGYGDGIRFYLVPEWDRLLDPEVWSAAASQVLFSLGICYGGLMALASYNNFKNNIFRDAMIVASVNMGTSIFGGFVTFSLIGSIAHETNRQMKDLVESGPDLLFVVYPLGLSNLPAPAIWSFLFFLMVFTLGLDSQFAMMEAVVVGITDRFPDTLRKHRIKFVLACCVVCFILGLPLTTKGGMHILTLYNWYAASYALIMLSFLELVIVAWIYGVRNFVSDIELMIGKMSPRFWRYWMAMWKFVTPIMLIFIFVMAMVSYSPAVYEGKTIPGWAEFIGWMMVLGPVFCVIGRAVKVLLYRKIPFCESFKPTDQWGPLYKEDAVDDYMTVTDLGAAGNTVMQNNPSYCTADMPNTSVSYINSTRDTYLEPSSVDRTNALAITNDITDGDAVRSNLKNNTDDTYYPPTKCPSQSTKTSQVRDKELMV